MGHHQCACECEAAKSAIRYERDRIERAIVQQEVDAYPERSSIKFAWFPMRCPTMNKRFWFERVNVIERSRVAYEYIGWGIGRYIVQWEVAWLEKL